MRAGVTPRTVRYYVAEGLLPAPGGAGRHRTYTEEHLLRLEAIRRLKESYLPLAEIRERLEGLDEEGLRKIAESPPEAQNSALSYVNSVLAASAPRAARPGPVASSALPRPGTTWQRVELAPGVELSFRPSSSPERERAIERFIREARRALAGLPPGDTEEQQR